MWWKTGPGRAKSDAPHTHVVQAAASILLLLLSYRPASHQEHRRHSPDAGLSHNFSTYVREGPGRGSGASGCVVAGDNHQSLPSLLVTLGSTSPP